MKKLITTLLCSVITLGLLTGCALEIRLVDTKNSSEQLEEVESKETINTVINESETAEESVETQETESTEETKLKPSEPVSIPEISVETTEESTSESNEIAESTSESTEIAEEEQSTEESESNEPIEETETGESVDTSDKSGENESSEPVDTTATSEETTETEEIEIVTISDDWKVMEFALKDSKITIPSNLDDIEKAGWYITLDDYTLKAGTRTTCDIDLLHQDYLDKDNTPVFKMQIGFKNSLSVDKNINQCEVYTLQINGLYEKGLKKNLPELEMAKGITFGSTIEDIEDAYGKPSSKIDKNNYTIYTYEEGNSTMKLTIHNGIGLTKIELKHL